MQKTILAAVQLPHMRYDFEQLLQETEALCEACGRKVAAVITQVSRSMDPAAVFRKGKLEELCALVKETEADLIVFHNEISVQAAARISSETGCPVIDRTALILDIFSLRARTKQARLQTEIARLRYDLPSVSMDRQDSSGHERGGGVTNRGGGEMRSSLVRRRYEARIKQLEEELDKMEKRGISDERRRQRTMYARAAAVGYTNAGKSSLLNAVLAYTGGRGSRVEEKDMLFATLDTSVRTVEYRRKKFFLYDTVGFVSHLPHTLIEAFRATLVSARDADLLIHVIDASDPDRERKAEITRETLHAIKADEIPVLTVYNKIDRIKDGPLPDGLCISCIRGDGIGELLSAVTDLLYPNERSLLCRIPYACTSVIDARRSVLDIEVTGQDEEGILCRIAGPDAMIREFMPYRVKGEHTE